MSLKKIVFFALLIASFFIINNLVRSIYTLSQKKDLVVKARQDLAKEKAENQDLKKKLAVVNRPQFVEEEARNKLFLAKAGEGIVVIPTDYFQQDISKSQPKDLRQNWQKWWDLFF